MIGVTPFNSQALTKHTEPTLLEESGEHGHNWRPNLSYGASEPEIEFRSSMPHDLQGRRACARDVGQPLFIPTAQRPESGGWKTMGVEEALARMATELPSTENFICVVQKCRENKVLDHAKRLHTHICINGLEDYRVLGNYLVAMFVDCGSLCDAEQAFNRLLHQKEHSWTALIHGYIEGAELQHALNLYQKMKENCVHPSRYTFLALLKACTRLKSIERGREIEAEIAKWRLSGDPFVGNALVDMYAKCGLLAEAQEVFDKLPVQDVVSWNALITGYAEHGLGKDALRCLEEMQLKGVTPNPVTYLCSLKACGSLGALDRGRKIHLEIAKIGFERDLFHGNSILDMYGKCGSLAEARQVFDELDIRDVVSWTALISGYAEHGFGEEAVTCLKQMGIEGVSPNAVTFVCSLKACASIGAADKGQKTHSQIVKVGFERAPLVGNTLLDMYAKCGFLSEAQVVFAELPARDVVSWSAIIAGYAEHGLHEEVLNHFEQMQLEGVSPNEFSWNAVILGLSEQVKSEKAFNLYLQMLEKGLLPNIMTFASVLKASGNTAALQNGKKIHAQVYRAGLEATEVILATALIDMYGKCGGMVEAQQVFDTMPKRDLVAWSAMITGYARQGQTLSVLSTYERMREEGIQPDEMTFLSILTMCSHAGLVEKGWKYFESMSNTNVTALTIKHLNCMVDLLGRAGRLDEAILILEGMPFEPDLVTCSTMLSACRTWGNVELGRHAFECAVRLDEKHQTAYILMFNIYTDAHMWEEAKNIEIMYAKLQARDVPGQSWVEVDGLVYAFVGADMPHLQSKNIYEKLKHIMEHYLPDIDRVSEDNTKDDTFCEHSERLAVVCGLLNTSIMAPIRVAKNLRVCDDCHVFLALLSKMEQRTIICRDASCCHAFKNGACSCSDYSSHINACL